MKNGFLTVLSVLAGIAGLGFFVAAFNLQVWTFNESEFAAIKIIPKSVPSWTSRFREKKPLSLAEQDLSNRIFELEESIKNPNKMASLNSPMSSSSTIDSTSSNTNPASTPVQVSLSKSNLKEIVSPQVSKSPIKLKELPRESPKQLSSLPVLKTAQPEQKVIEEKMASLNKVVEEVKSNKSLLPSDSILDKISEISSTTENEDALIPMTPEKVDAKVPSKNSENETDVVKESTSEITKERVAETNIEKTIEKSTEKIFEKSPVSPSKMIASVPNIDSEEMPQEKIKIESPVKKKKLEIKAESKPEPPKPDPVVKKVIEPIKLKLPTEPYDQKTFQRLVTDKICRKFSGKEKVPYIETVTTCGPDLYVIDSCSNEVVSCKNENQLKSTSWKYTENEQVLLLSGKKYFTKKIASLEKVSIPKNLEGDFYAIEENLTCSPVSSSKKIPTWKNRLVFNGDGSMIEAGMRCTAQFGSVQKTNEKEFYLTHDGKLHQGNISFKFYKKPPCNDQGCFW